MKGVVYKVVYNDTIIYIGSTTNIKSRIYQHKYNCYNEKTSAYNMKIYKYIRENDIDWDDITFETIEEVEMNNLTELKKLEGKYIKEHLDLLNVRLAGQGNTEEEMKEYMKEWHIKTYPQRREAVLQKKKEYYQKNKQERIDYQKQYYYANRERLLKYQNEYEYNKRYN